MASLRGLRASRFLRRMALGLLAKPVLAASCELGDLQSASGGERVVMLDDAGTTAGDECCPGQACGECCTPGTVLPSASAVVGAIPAQAATPKRAAF